MGQERERERESERESIMECWGDPTFVDSIVVQSVAAEPESKSEKGGRAKMPPLAVWGRMVETLGVAIRSDERATGEYISQALQTYLPINAMMHHTQG